MKTLFLRNEVNVPTSKSLYLLLYLSNKGWILSFCTKRSTTKRVKDALNKYVMISLSWWPHRATQMSYWGKHFCQHFNVCVTDIDDCANVTCQNNATCQDLVNDYMCACDISHTGRHCESSKYFNTVCKLCETMQYDSTKAYEWQLMLWNSSILTFELSATFHGRSFEHLFYLILWSSWHN